MAAPRISLEEARRVAALARLAFTDDELEAMRASMDVVLGHMAELDAVDVEGVEPTFHAVPMPAPLRPDVLVPSLAREAALAAAPEQEHGGFRVPKVVEKG
jgi:aspartyl-tRNA(Asn)/glutamyl-tRNA(Gln) amidotransferase subunit C